MIFQILVNVIVLKACIKFEIFAIRDKQRESEREIERVHKRSLLRM